jgi:hypothetical protein
VIGFNEDTFADLESIDQTAKATAAGLSRSAPDGEQ